MNKIWGVWCATSGGVTGRREAWLKINGEIAAFETEEQAREKAVECRSALRNVGPALISYQARRRAI